MSNKSLNDIAIADMKTVLLDLADKKQNAQLNWNSKEIATTF
jgi:hypothetical protein